MILDPSYITTRVLAKLTFKTHIINWFLVGYHSPKMSNSSMEEVNYKLDVLLLPLGLCIKDMKKEGNVNRLENSKCCIIIKEKSHYIKCKISLNADNRYLYTGVGYAHKVTSEPISDVGIQMHRLKAITGALLNLPIYDKYT